MTTQTTGLCMFRPFGAPRIHFDEFATDGGDVSTDPGPVVREASANTPAALSISQAARALQAARKKPAVDAEPVAAANEPAAESAALELSDEGDAAPAETQATGETDG